MSTTTYIHHPECDQQDVNLRHQDIGGACRSSGTGPLGDRVFEGWPKSGPGAQEAPSAPFPPEGFSGQPTPVPAGVAADGPAEADPSLSSQSVVTKTAAEWKNKAHPIELAVPSGNTCLVRRRGGMGMFLKNGKVPNNLMPIIQKHMNDGLQVDMAKAAKDVEDNPELLNDILTMANNVVLESVMQPPVFPIPIFTEKDQSDGTIPPGMNVGDVVPSHMRDENFLYVDEVDMEDKMFIFQWACGGSSDLDRFRTEQAAALESIPTVEGVGAEAVGDPAD